MDDNITSNRGTQQAPETQLNEGYIERLKNYAHSCYESLPSVPSLVQPLYSAWFDYTIKSEKNRLRGERREREAAEQNNAPVLTEEKKEHTRRSRLE